MLIVDVDGRSLSAEEWARSELPKQVAALGDDVAGLCAVARVVLDEGLAVHAGALLAALRRAAPAAPPAGDDVASLVHALARAHAEALRTGAPSSISSSISSIPLTGPVWAAVLADAPAVAACVDSVAVVALADEARGVADVRAGNVVFGDASGIGAAAVLAEHVAARVDVNGVVVVPVVADHGVVSFVGAPDVVDVLPLLPRPLPRLVVTGARLSRSGGARVALRVFDLRDGQETLVVDAPSLAEACTPLVRAVSTLTKREKHRAVAHAPAPADLDDDFVAGVGALFVSLCVATKQLQAAQASPPSSLTALWSKRPATLYAQAAQKLAALLAAEPERPRSGRP